MLLEIRGVYNESGRVQALTMGRLFVLGMHSQPIITLSPTISCRPSKMQHANARVAFAGMWNLFIHACAEEHTTSLRFKSHGEGDTDMQSECILHLE